MNIGIIGSEAAKFTPVTRITAIDEIYNLIQDRRAVDGQLPTIVSGHCHLGGIDIWAEEIAREQGCTLQIFPPHQLSWERGYKQRNIQIAEASDKIYVITLKELPSTYKGMKFTGCYHCDKPTRKHKQVAMTHCGKVADANHIKSGACWTAWYAIEKLDKPAEWIII